MNGYEWLRLIAEIILPGLATLYAAVSAVWGFPYAGEITETVVAVDVFVGLIVRYLRKRYNLSAEPLTGDNENE